MQSRYQLTLNVRSAAITLVAGLAALAGYLSPSQQDLNPPVTHARLFPAQLLESSPLQDRVLGGGGNAGGDLSVDEPYYYPFGRWKSPVENVTFHTDSQGGLASSWKANTFQTKMWHYSSFDTKDYFIGMAIVKLGYANDAFLYVVDKTTPGADKFEYSVRLPGSLGLSFATSSIDDKICTTSQAPFSSESISFCYERAADEWRIQATTTTVAPTTGESRLFMADLLMKREEALVLLFPLGNDTIRPAYVHKAAGSPVRGSFTFGNVSVELQEDRHSDSNQLQVAASALGAIDWTRSLALRCTKWNWASSSFRARVQTTRRSSTELINTGGDKIPEVSSVKVASVGINLSKDVYDIDGESQENAIWINGRVFVLRGVLFTVPEDPMREEWHIRSVKGLNHELVNLTFTPRGSREDHTKLLLMESDFVQPFGTFNGQIRFTNEEGDDIRVNVEDAFGVVEKHFAIW